MTAGISSPLESFVSKLDRRAPLPRDACEGLLALPFAIVRAEANEVVAKEGAGSTHSLFLASGFVSRQKHVGDKPHIMGICVPGDAIDLQSLWFHRQDHSIVAHESSTVVSVHQSEIARLCERLPSVVKALWHDTLVEAAIFREWALNIAHRRASLRLAHLFLEVATRRNADVFALPLIQSDLASALGLSLVHTNKSLKALRDEGLIEVRGRTIALLNRPALEEQTDFDAGYLHIETAPRFWPDTATATTCGALPTAHDRTPSLERCGSAKKMKPRATARRS